MSTTTNHHKQPHESWLRQAADLEDQFGSTSVGGMAHTLGLLKTYPSKPSGVFGRFIEFARRKQHLSVEDLASQTTVSNFRERPQGPTSSQDRSETSDLSQPARRFADGVSRFGSRQSARYRYGGSPVCCSLRNER